MTIGENMKIWDEFLSMFGVDVKEKEPVEKTHYRISIILNGQSTKVFEAVTNLVCYIDQGSLHVFFLSIGPTVREDVQMKLIFSPTQWKEYRSEVLNVNKKNVKTS